MRIFFFVKCLVVTLLVFALHGCSLLLKNNYGYNEPSRFNEMEYTKFLTTIDTSNSIQIRSDTSQFKQFVSLAKDSIQKKDLSQPIQLLYFDGANLVSYHANCYAKGTLSGIDWNYENRFVSFPPKSAIDSMSFDFKLHHLSALYKELHHEKKYTVIVIWSWMLEGVSRDAISIVQNNIKENDVENEVQLILINIDAFWLSRAKH